MRNKLKVPALLLYFIGLALVGFGVSLMIRADLGITVITSFPYALSVITGLFTVGMWFTIIQCIVLLLAVFLLKRLTVSMVTSFITGFLLGLSIDLMTLVVQHFSFVTFFARILAAIAASLVTGIGAGTLIFSSYPPVPDLVFVRDIAHAKKISLTKVKMMLDGTFFILTIALTLLVTGHIFGVGWGTAMSLLIIGFVVGRTNRLLAKVATRAHLFGEEKETKFFEYNLLSYFSANKKTAD